ncbi:unnamed protein product [Knipowitschia caucasica]|uniref:Peptidase M12B propeptide domain-containing protein n=1 Tax=Knipowitschia caucasica TaxID=637954 RepID=A0AAV2MLH4_KNICA
MSACDAGLSVMVLLCVAALPQGAVYNDNNKVSGSILGQVQQYEVTHPIWLQRRRRSPSAEQQQHPAKAQVVIRAEGQDLTLHLEKNE